MSDFFHFELYIQLIYQNFLQSQLIGMILTKICHQCQLTVLYKMTHTIWQSVKTHMHIYTSFQGTNSPLALIVTQMLNEEC